MRLNILLALGCALPLAACSQPHKSTATPTVSADPVAAGADAGARCDPEKLTGLAGQTATEAVIKKAVQDSGARHARVLKPGMAMTMDFREDRLSIEVDAQNRIVRANCG
ncbi:I78 family peptidase inhibitor [Stenotrophomonas rhizophila]|uniref:I78 family peptidase inhibitor n=1 Tax=Stenotrophomonas rhizophila TaxID=216778 RepID=UPI001E2E4303|nr:I78 family peptidase inhibitor [Stenotrophomonas rhizophila]MCC7633232.1 hypothetical protein [Stenotrophomonas rhizophila]MCC7662125.1 hypothetical protein [Stenotrophomonas rhizophila]